MAGPPRQVRLGLIGLTAEWDAVYRPAVAHLGNRGLVSAVCAAERRLVEELAQDLGVRCCGGIRALVRSSLDGVIAASPAWHGWYPAHLCAELGRDCYIALPCNLEPACVVAIQQLARQRGTLVMPELRLRYTPATLRLRELLATEIGPVESIDVAAAEIRGLSPDRVAVEVVDWSRTVLGGLPVAVASHDERTPGGEVRRQIRVSFRSGTAAGGDMAVSFRQVIVEPPADVGFSPQATSPLAADAWPLEFAVRGKFGEARLEDAMHLRCRTGGRERIESLAVDRSAVTVSIDHFARRLAGGLVPVPDLGDVGSAMRIVKLAGRSRVTGETIDLLAPGT